MVWVGSVAVWGVHTFHVLRGAHCADELINKPCVVACRCAIVGALNSRKNTKCPFPEVSGLIKLFCCACEAAGAAYVNLTCV